MAQAVREIYEKDIRFLIGLKKSVGMLNNRIHDNLALIAISHFQIKHPKWTFHYSNAGAAGIDIIGRDKTGTTRLIAEVKTTLPDHRGYLRGPQRKNLEKDLERLSAESGSLERVFVLLSKATKEAVERQIRATGKYPNITLFNALEEPLTEDEQNEDEEV